MEKTMIKEHREQGYEQGQQHEKRYKSPQRKLVKFFEKSRDAWKAKCGEAKRTVKRLKNRIRFLQQSKEQWKDRARNLERELEQLKAEKQSLAEKYEGLKKKWERMKRP
jgi:predicted  nucleic acid-binding Zn-ribbon protein